MLEQSLSQPNQLEQDAALKTQATVIDTTELLLHPVSKLPNKEVITKNYPQSFADELAFFGIEAPKKSTDSNPFLQTDTDFSQESPKWLLTTEMTKEDFDFANRIVFQAGPGLGDAHIMSGILLALAKSTPTKEFVLSLPPTMQHIFDVSKLPANLKLLFEGQQGDFAFTRTNFENTSQLLISLNDDTEGDFRNAELLKSAIGFNPIFDKVHTAETFTVHARLDDNKDAYKIVDYLRLFNSQLPEMYQNDYVSNNLPGQEKSPFLADQIALRMLLAYDIKINPEDLDLIRYGLPVDLGLTEDEIKQPANRLTIAYDGKAGEGKKLLTSDQWAEFINDILSDPQFTANIDIARGLDNPTLADQILSKVEPSYISRVQIKDFSNLRDFEKHLVTSKYVASVDSVGPHAIDNAKKTYHTSFPTVIGFYGTEAGFNLNEYILGTTAVISEGGTVKDLAMDDVYSKIKPFLT